MKKHDLYIINYALLTCFIVYISCGSDENVISKKYHSNGKLSYLSILDTTTNESIYRHYFKNGNLKEEYYKVDDKLEDQVVHYYQNGEKKAIETYSNGFRNGVATRYYENGQINETSRFVNNKRQGDLFHYLPNGRLKAINTYHDNKIVYKEVYVFDTLGIAVDTYISIKPIISVTPPCPTVGESAEFSFLIPNRASDFNSDDIALDFVIGVVRGDKIIFKNDDDEHYEKMTEGKYTLETTVIDSMTISGQMEYKSKKYEGFSFNVFPCE